MCIALRAEPVISFPRGVYLPRGFGSRGGGNLHFLLPTWRCIARGKYTRIEFAVGLASPSLRYRLFSNDSCELIEQPVRLAHVAVQFRHHVGVGVRQDG